MTFFIQPGWVGGLETIEREKKNKKISLIFTHAHSEKKLSYRSLKFEVIAKTSTALEVILGKEKKRRKKTP